VRQGLRALLEKNGFEVVGEAGDGREALRLAEELKPQVAVLDLSMPLLNGLDVARALLKQPEHPVVVLLTLHREDQYVLDALRAGVQGYVLKNQAPEDLVDAVREVLRGAVYLSPSIARVLVDAFLHKGQLPSDPLSPREREVLQLVAEGKTTKEVAQVLGISVKTADSHRSRLMEKLEIHETASLVRYAIRRGLVQP
jgi:two-component system, NarL family, response regulator NreC